MTANILLWCLVGIIGSGMLGFLVLGLLKGMNWERELSRKRR